MLKDQLKALRESKKLTKKQVANDVGISDRAYIAYEYGERDVSTETLQKLADFYNVTTDYLLGRCEPKPPNNPLEQLPLKELERIIIERYMELPEKQRELVIDFIHKCIAEEERRKSLKEQSQKPLEPIEESSNPNIIKHNGIVMRACPVAVRSEDNIPPHVEMLTEEEIEKIRNAENVPDDL